MKKNIIAISKMIPLFLIGMGILYAIAKVKELQGVLIVIVIGVVCICIILAVIAFLDFIGGLWCEGWRHFSNLYNSRQHEKLMKYLKEEEEKKKQEENLDMI